MWSLDAEFGIRRLAISNVTSFVGGPEESLLMERIEEVFGDVIGDILLILQYADVMYATAGGSCLVVFVRLSKFI